MFIDIHDLELRPLDFNEEFRPAIIDFGPDIRQTSSLTARGRAELLEECHGGKRDKILDIRLVGSLATRLEVSCARCLEPVGHTVTRDFDLLYRPQGVDGGREELSVTAVEAEIGYYSGDGMLLEDVLREQVLLALPIKTVCREECKGLCPQCGKNLNQGECLCARPADVRWHALDGLRDKLHR
jgi:uncharacterized protein